MNISRRSNGTSPFANRSMSDSLASAAVRPHEGLRLSFLPLHPDSYITVYM
jgi:hypothetical protein